MNINLSKGAAELILDSIGNESFNVISEFAKAKLYLSALNKDKNNSKSFLVN